MSTEVLDLQSFCDNKGEVGRYSFGQPFVQFGWRYATDGRVVVRVPTEDANTTGRPLPTMRKLDWAMLQGVEKWSEVSEPLGFQPDSELRDCLACGEFVTCSKCKVDGTCECSCGDCHDCHECTGDGAFYTTTKDECDECEGSRKQRFKAVVLGMLVNVDYMRAAMKLPGVKFAAMPNCGSGDHIGAIGFKFDGGGEGIIMSIRKQ